MQAMTTRWPVISSRKMRAWRSLGIFFQMSRTDFNSVIMLVSEKPRDRQYWPIPQYTKWHGLKRENWEMSVFSNWFSDAWFNTCFV